MSKNGSPIAVINNNINNINNNGNGGMKTSPRTSSASPVTPTIAGVGLLLVEQNGVLVVTGKVANGPCDSADIQRGDILLQIDGYAAGSTVMGVRSLLIGPVGSVIKLGIRRGNSSMVIAVKRALLPSSSSSSSSSSLSNRELFRSANTTIGVNVNSNNSNNNIRARSMSPVVRSPYQRANSLPNNANNNNFNQNMMSRSRDSSPNPYNNNNNNNNNMKNFNTPNQNNNLIRPRSASDGIMGTSPRVGGPSSMQVKTFSGVLGAASSPPSSSSPSSQQQQQQQHMLTESAAGPMNGGSESALFVANRRIATLESEVSRLTKEKKELVQRVEEERKQMRDIMLRASELEAHLKNIEMSWSQAAVDKAESKRLKGRVRELEDRARVAETLLLESKEELRRKETENRILMERLWQYEEEDAANDNHHHQSRRSQQQQQQQQDRYYKGDGDSDGGAVLHGDGSLSPAISL